jgi:nucleoid DNA-binding protein
MDNKNFLTALAKDTGIDVKTAATLCEKLAGVLANVASELDNSAIPGFGTFVSHKEDERIVELESGAKSLLPPRVSVSFTSGSKLRKNINANKR